MVVGLGNPGPKYTDTRHNIGFAIVDVLQKRWNCGEWSRRFDAEWLQIVRVREDGSALKVHLAKPQTFMNLSGRSVSQVLQFFKLNPATELLVITDDLDLPVGQLRLRLHGGSGGHNGLRSIAEGIGEKFARLRVGIGRSERVPADVHVLEKIAPAEREAYATIAQNGADAVETCLQKGLVLAMNKIHQKPAPPKKTVEGKSE